MSKTKITNNLNQQIINNLDFLKDREKEILISRFGLANENCKTLQSIGNKYKITRERIRQIINHTIKKIQKANNTNLQDLTSKIENQAKLNGGLIPEHNLTSKINPVKKGLNINGAIELICRINPNLKRIKKSSKTQIFWTIKNIKLNKILKINNILSTILKDVKKTLSVENLAKEYKKRTKQTISPQTIISISSGSNNLLMISQNKIGLSSWPDINPKNTRDKIHYILTEIKKPLHFSEITEKINAKKFTTKNPTKTTVHNELISDNRFVLIGRGIYALRKWGFKPGSTFDLLKDELSKNKKGLSQKELCERILKKRIISKNTIIMNLNSHSIFSKNNNGIWKIKPSRRKSK